MILKGSQIVAGGERSDTTGAVALSNLSEPKLVDLPFPQLPHHVLDQKPNSLDPSGLDRTLACLSWWHRQ